MQNESIKFGFERLKAFLKVNGGKPTEEKIAAVDNFALGAGLTEENWTIMCDQLGDVVDSPGGELGWAIVGLILGLYIAQREEELNAANDRNASL